MKSKNLIFWVDMLTGPVCSAPPAALRDAFDTRSVAGDQHLAEKIGEHRPLALFYDCDYPDQRRLKMISECKSTWRSIPFILVTLQHSESLAVWAFRCGALDYLVKPIQPVDLEKCIQRLTRIAESLGSQQARKLHNPAVELPHNAVRQSARAEDKLGPAIWFVQNHYAKRIYSDAVARLCGLSTTYFSKAFRKRFDMSFQEFLLRYRVAQACQMLENPRANISDVCYSVGFRDPAYFARVFKRYCGVSPSNFEKADKRNLLSQQLFALDDDPLNSSSSSQIVRSLAGQFGN